MGRFAGGVVASGAGAADVTGTACGVSAGGFEALFAAVGSGALASPALSGAFAGSDPFDSFALSAPSSSPKSGR